MITWNGPDPVVYDGTTRNALLAALHPGTARDALARAADQIEAPRPARVEVERVHFSNRRPVVIQYRVFRAASHQPHRIYAELVGENADLHAAAETSRLAKSRRAQIARGDRRQIVADTATGLVFREPGLDARLPGLKLLAAPDEARELAAQALDMPAGETDASVTLCAHRLGKRAVLRIDLDGSAGKGRVYMRLRPTSNESGRTAYEQHCRIAGALERSDDVIVPRPLGYDEDLGAAIYSELPGDRPVFGGHEGIRAMRNSFVALGAFRNLRIDLPREHGVSDEKNILESWVRRVAALRPDLAGIVMHAWSVVADDLRGLIPVTPAPCHRDFHDGQVLLGSGPAGLLDFDTACMSDPMLDIGNFLAHVRLDWLRRARTDDPAAMLPDAAERHDLAAGHRLAVWTRAAMLRLGCVYALTSERPGLPRALIERAIG